MYLPLPGCVALRQNELWKHGADEAAADRRQGPHSVVGEHSLPISALYSSYYGLGVCNDLLKVWRKSVTLPLLLIN